MREVELIICDEQCAAPAPAKFRGIAMSSSVYNGVAELSVYYKREGGGYLYVFEGGGRLFAGQRDEAGSWWYLLFDFSGEFAEYPAPPYPGALREGGRVWSRFVSSDFARLVLPGGGEASVESPLRGDDVLDAGNHAEPAAEVLLLRYEGRWLEREPRWWVVKSAAFPGTGKLTGEEFRIVEPENDYLRLVGRGGDEYIAWDFVLGTLVSGEWVLMADDGLYKAKMEGDRVVVVGPYGGFLQDVRGPPLAYKYPVVPTRSFRHAAALGAYVVYDASLLKWPLTAGPAAGRPADLPQPGVLYNAEYGVAYCCKAYRGYAWGD